MQLSFPAHNFFALIPHLGTGAVTSTHKSFSEAEAAEFLGVSRGTLQQWRHHKKGPIYSRIGGRIVYFADRLEEYRREREVKPEGKP